MDGNKSRKRNHFLGAILKPGHSLEEFCPDEQSGCWSDEGARGRSFLRNAPNQSLLQTWDGMAILLRGYCRQEGTYGALNLDSIVADLRHHYLESGELKIDHLDGSFTIALIDSRAGRVILYRNLIGNGFTYYRSDRSRFVFGSNLPEVNRVWGGSPEPNSDAIPSFFLFRCVPGRETLFHDVFRLMPGEEVVWDGAGVNRRIRARISHFLHSPIRPSEAGECLEKTVADVLRDGHQFRPQAANLLSGGVDSSYLQFVWNHFVHQKDNLPRSFSISVDHPHTWPDSDYSMTASQLIGTRHQFIPADQPYSHYLRDAISLTGEPPNHVQSAYFGHLARIMVREGCDTGICGEGADSLFGLGLANQFHNAETLRWMLPSRMGRRLGGKLCELLGFDSLSYTFDLSNRKTDYSWLHHPVNRVATFTHLQSVIGCFGEGAVMKALEQRRELLDQYDVPDDPMDRLHAMGFLG
ncbi:MAG: asparagine synthase-related protein, partial [Gemmataceae bacterium]